MQPRFLVKHYSESNNVDSGTIPQTDLPRLSAVVQHMRKMVSEPRVDSERGKKSKLTKRVPALNTNQSPTGAVLCVWMPV